MFNSLFGKLFTQEDPQYSSVYVFLDVDGVLSPVQETIPDGYTTVEAEQGQWHLHRKHRDWLTALQEHGATLIWETIAGKDANDFIIPFYNMHPFPCVDYENINIRLEDESDSRTFKLPFIADSAKNKPTVIVDDELRADVDAWAEEREAPTLIVRPDPAVGVNEREREKVIAFVKKTLGR